MRVAEGRQDHAHHAARSLSGEIAGGHALENRIVFAVDRDQLGARLTHFIHEQPAGHDQRFLVGEQHALGGSHRRQGRRQPGSTHDRRHHDIDVIAGNGLGERLGAACHTRRAAAVAQRSARQSGGLGVHQHDGARLKLPRLVDDGSPAAARGENRDLEAVRMHGDHAERAAPDAAGGSQDGKPVARAHAITPVPNSPSA
jgi:hypothetical protein